MESNPSNPEPEPYDLLNGKNDLFYVTFDILTPRPHFIIKPKDWAAIDVDFAKMIENQTQLQTLMEAVQSMMVVMSGYGIKSSILSFHRGSWHTNHRERTFHAHLCVLPIDVELYLNVFAHKKEEIGTSTLWTEDKTPENYPTLVRESLKKSHFKKEVTNIGRLPVILPDVGWPSVDQEGIREVLHPSHPKIGFVGKKGKIPPEKLIEVIDNFAKKLSLTNLKATDDYDGCHVCLYLDSGKLIFYSSACI